MDRHQSLGKLFIGGLSWDTTNEKLREYYEKFGELTDSIVMQDRDTGTPRGFGFVTYKDETIAEQVAASVHELDGRKVDTKLAVNRDGAIPAGHGGDTAVPEASPKLFIGGVSPMSTEGAKDCYLARFPNPAAHTSVLGWQVLEIVLMKDHQTGASRGFGFVTFKDTAAADECVKEARYHNIDDKQVEVKSAETRQERTQIENQGTKGGGKGKGKGKGGKGGYGKGGGGPMRGSWRSGGHSDGYGGGKGYGDSYGGGKGYGDYGGGYGDWGGGYNGSGDSYSYSYSYGGGKGYDDSYGGGKGYGDSYGGGKGYGDSYGGGGDSYGGGKGYGDSYGGGKGYGDSYGGGKGYGDSYGGGKGYDGGYGGYDGYGGGGYGDGYGGNSGYGGGKGGGGDNYARADALDYNTGAGANDASAASALESVMGALAGQLSGGARPAANGVSTDNNRYHPYSNCMQP